MTGPLAGRSVLVTRPQHQAARLIAAIQAAGGEAIAFPALGIEALRREELAPQLGALAQADCVIFISPNAAQFGLDAIGSLPAAARVFAVGPGTARVLRERGVEAIVPAGQDSEALLELPQLQDVAGKRVVIVRGVGGRPYLGDTLRARGASVHYVECYRRVCPVADATPLIARWQAGGVDAVTLASAETLANLATLLGESGRPLLAATPLFVPHEKIAESARRFGATRVITTAGGDDGLVEGLIDWFRNSV